MRNVTASPSPPVGYMDMATVRSSPPPSAALFSPRPIQMEMHEQNVFSFSDRNVPASPLEMATPVETSALLDEENTRNHLLQERLENAHIFSNEDTNCLGPPSPTSLQIATNNNEKEVVVTSSPEYTNLECVLPNENLSSSISSSPTNSVGEVVVDMNNETSEVSYINLKNMENSPSSNYINLPSHQDANYINTNAVV